MSDEDDVPDYAIGGGSEKKRVRKPRSTKTRIRVIRPKIKSLKPVKRK